MEHYVPRREFNDHAPVKPQTLHCYGVDQLNTKEIFEIFAKFKASEVEWLDDSSCNVVFQSEKDAQAAVRDLREVPQDVAGGDDDPWCTTKTITVSGPPKGGAVVKTGPRQRSFQLQIRKATEADRKDPGHSGHTDSVYYAKMKEEQALQKQRQELRQEKKRQRHNSRDPPANLGSNPFAPSPLAATGSASSSTAPAKLGLMGLMDPLLFLRVPKETKTQGESGEKASFTNGGDLSVALQRAEAEYAAIPLSAPAQQPQEPRSLEGTPFGPTPQGQHQRAGSTGAPARGKKRQPTEQEPRPVSSSAPAMRRVQALPEVEAFLKTNKVRCQRFALNRSFRTVLYAGKKVASKQKAEAASDTKENERPAATVASLLASLPTKTAVQKLPPWDQYLHLNRHFAKRGQFMHTVVWMSGQRKILTLVPHPLRVDVEKVAKAAQVPVETVKQQRLADIAKDTGFPVFVTPPIGHPKDASGAEPLLLIDSSVMELQKPLLFDCGSVGLCLKACELIRSTKASCVEGLARPVDKQGSAAAAAPTAATPQPGAPEPMEEIEKPAAQDSMAQEATAAGLRA